MIYDYIAAFPQSSSDAVAVSSNVSYGCNRNYLGGGAHFPRGNSGASQMDGETLDNSYYEN